MKYEDIAYYCLQIENKEKIKKNMRKLLSPVSPELEEVSEKKYDVVFEEMWDYVMFGVLGVPLYREHTCFEDGDYCDFKLKIGAETLPYWPPVFTQNNSYK